MKAGQSFDEVYSETEEMYGHPYKELQDYFKQHPKGSVLDLGCGQGRDTLFLASIGYDVTAVDISEVGIAQMMNKAKEKGLDIKGVVSSVTDLRLDQKFDIILFDMILHSFGKEQQRDILEKYSGCLTKKGILCIVFPDDLSSEHFMGVMRSFPGKWELKDEIVIRDVPTIEGEEKDYQFRMIVVQKIIEKE